MKTTTQGTSPENTSSVKRDATLDDKELLSEVELARRLGITIRCLQQWRWQRWGPAWIKVGRLVRYPRAEVAAFLERQKVATAESRREEILTQRKRGRPHTVVNVNA